MGAAAASGGASSFWGSPGGAALIGAGSQIAGSLFGGDGYSRWKRQLRKQYEYAQRYEPGLIGARLKGTVQGAKAAGIHPLLAMGANASGSPVLQGQPDSPNRAQNVGSAIAEAMYQISDQRASAELVRAQADLSRARAMEHQLSNDTNQALSNPPGNAPLKSGQVRRPGENTAHVPNVPEQSLDEMSPWRKLRWGDQEIWVLAEDMESLLDNPLKAIGSAYFYHGNKGVDWSKAGRDYLYGKGPVKRRSTSTNWVGEYEKFLRQNRGNKARTRPVRTNLKTGPSKSLKQHARTVRTEKSRRQYMEKYWRKNWRRFY